MHNSPKVWLITGSSGGLGEELALRALSAGDKVIATSRSPSRLNQVKSAGAAVLELDQNKSLNDVKAAVEEAIKIYGTIDFFVANAGYVQGGTLEETTPEETLRQMQANVFGPLNLFRAVLPHMRSKRSGTLISIGSMAAWQQYPGSALYPISKATMRAVSMVLDDEVKGFGIKTCLVEPGAFQTELLAPSSNLMQTNSTVRIADYTEVNKAMEGLIVSLHGTQPGDAAKGAEVMYDVFTSSGVAQGKPLPKYLPLGSDAVEVICSAAQQTIDETKAWAEIASLSDAEKS